MVRHKIKDILANNKAMLLKLGRNIAHYEIYQMVHFLMLLWQHAQFQFLSSSKSNITICSYKGQNIQKNVKEETQWKVGLAYVLDKIRYFALLSRKWYYLILKRQETGTEHVAIATSKCVPFGITRRVQHHCQVSRALLHYWRR